MKISLKKVLFFVVIILLIIIAKNFSKIEKKIALIKSNPEHHLYQTMVNWHIFKQCFTSGSMVELVNQEGYDYYKHDLEITSKSLKKLSNLENTGEIKIPLITHHVYFTSEANPAILKEFYIEKIIANYTKLNDLNLNWKHYIWTNKPDLFPEKILTLKGVEIKDITEFKNHKLYPSIVTNIKKGESFKAYYTEASDSLRFLALDKFGGVYSDMDYEIYNADELLKLLKNFDFIAGRERTANVSFYGISFMAAKANHPIISNVIKNMYEYDVQTDKSALPYYIKYPCTEFDKLYFRANPNMTVSVFKEFDKQGNSDIILPAWMMLNIDFARSKNGECTSLIDGRDFIEKNKNLNEVFESFEQNLDPESHILKISEVANADNIYYNLKDRKSFPIVGADMYCGSWSRGISPKKYFYMNWPFTKIKKNNYEE